MTSVRDQPWVRVRCPAGPRTVTKMSKISGYEQLIHVTVQVTLRLQCGNCAATADELVLLTEPQRYAITWGKQSDIAKTVGTDLTHAPLFKALLNMMNLFLADREAAHRLSQPPAAGLCRSVLVQRDVP